MVDLDRDAHVAQLGHDRVEVPHAEVHTPRARPELRALPVLTAEGREHGRPRVLVPGVVLVALGWEADAEVLGVPRRELLGIVGAEEEPADAGDALHGRDSAAPVAPVPGCLTAVRGAA